MFVSEQIALRENCMMLILADKYFVAQNVIRITNL
jgi:hypothetical protein